MFKYYYFFLILNMNMSLEIILGCMFSGKSTELLRRCNRYKAIGKNVLLLNHYFDTRTDNYIQTHHNQKEIAIKCTKLMSIIDSDLYTNADVIGIDEAQFFGDLYDFVLYAEQHDKLLIVCGLDGDSDRKPFGDILKCIPLCDTVVKLTAMDMKDRDGTPAIFSKRIVKKDSQIVIGAADEYIAVSRKNYIYS